MDKSKMKSYIGVGVVAVIVIIVAIVMLGGSKDDNSKTTGTANTESSAQTDANSTSTNSDVTGTSKVEIKGFAFGPSTTTVKVGSTVTWTNSDDVKHTVTADNKSSDAPDSQLFGKGESYTFTFNKAGTYTYHCEPHPYMKATVVVTN